MSADRWRLARDLYDRGDPEFVAVLRTVHDAETLAGFAGIWSDDPRPEARGLLLAYLEQPLNAFRHEGLVKRLFKRAEAAGDDAVMARLMVLLDRALDRHSQTIRRNHGVVVSTEAEARQREAEFRARGFASVNAWRDVSGGFRVVGLEQHERRAARSSSTMPRDELITTHVPDPTTGRWIRRAMPAWVLRLKLISRPGFDPEQLDPAQHAEPLRRYRLFSVASRQYLRRRCWRYFRHLGRTDPERYVTALTGAMALYHDSDFEPEPALLDRWSLVHALFHHSPMLRSDPAGWSLVGDHSIAELQPAPACPSAWASRPDALLTLIEEARSRLVRRWAIRLVKQDLAAMRDHLTPERLLGWLDHHDPEVVALVARFLRDQADLESMANVLWLPLWRKLLESRHDEIRRAVRADLERQAGSTPEDLANLPDLVDGDARARLRATALLGMQRGSRATMVVLRQLLRRLERRPGEAEALLPWIGHALRSSDGPSWRAGLSALVTLAERRVELRPAIEQAIPELSLSSWRVSNPALEPD